MIIWEFIIIIAITFFLCRTGWKYKADLSQTLIPQSVSLVLKSVCCVIILLHHYSFRVDIPVLGKYFRMGGAFFALGLFMFLSGYGVVKSEMNKSLKGWIFMKKRFLKLLIPFWVVNLFCILAYYIIGANNNGVEVPMTTNPYVLMPDRISESFFRIGSHSQSLWNYFAMLIGLDRIDGVDWFLRHILISYVLLYTAKSIFPVASRKFAFSSLYIIMLILVGYFYAIHDPFVSTNVWYWYSALGMGVIFATFEREILSWRGIGSIGAIITSVLIVLLIALKQHNIYYFVYTALAITLISLLSYVMRYIAISKDSLLFAFSSASFVFYLIHVKILNIEWWYFGYKSVCIPFLVISILSWVYYYFDRRIKANC